MTYLQNPSSHQYFQTPNYNPPAPPPDQGSGLPMDLANSIKSLLASLNSGGGSINGMGMPPTLPMSNLRDQYLARIEALTKQLGSGGLAPLTPEMQREFDARRQTMGNAITHSYDKMMGDAVAGMFGRGMEKSGAALNEYENISGQKAGAISNMNSNLFNEEMAMRQSIGAQQNQGILGQIGVLQNLLANVFQRDQMAQDRSDRMFENQMMLSQNVDQRRMQLIQLLASLAQQFPNFKFNSPVVK